MQRKVVRNNNYVFLLWIDINFSLFLVEFFQYLEIRYGFSSFLLGIYLELAVFVSFIFKCKKKYRTNFCKISNNFVFTLSFYTWIFVNIGILLYTRVGQYFKYMCTCLVFQVQVHFYSIFKEFPALFSSI